LTRPVTRPRKKFDVPMKLATKRDTGRS